VTNNKINKNKILVVTIFLLTQIYAVQKAINYFNIFTVLRYIYSITNCHQNNI